MKFFEPYITRLISIDISVNALEQLNSVLCTFAKKITDLSTRLLESAKKKTISEKEINGAVCILFKGSLRYQILVNGLLATNQFNSSFIIERTATTRQDRASIIFPPSLTEKFLRNFGYSTIMISTIAPVFLASILETIAVKLINSAEKIWKQTGCGDRVSIRDFELAVRTDEELDTVFKNLRLEFIGGGVVPFIHPTLLGFTERSLVKTVPSGRAGIVRLPSGELALQEIKKYQGISNSLMFARIPFEKIVRKIIREVHTQPVITIKVSKKIFLLIQYFVEQHTTELLRRANLVAIYAGRVKMSSLDIEFVQSLGSKI
jgi:histone H3/H4